MTENLDWLTDGADGGIELTEVDTVTSSVTECQIANWATETVQNEINRLVNELDYRPEFAAMVLLTAETKGLYPAIQLIN